ncbi:MAG: hypothetical protein GX126_03335 [Bacteroidales bacterium]|nr:hypothetical protein [Bacteroidales bacterium]
MSLYVYTDEEETSHGKSNFFNTIYTQIWRTLTTQMLLTITLKIAKAKRLPQDM